jgi:hypothetical protein
MQDDELSTLVFLFGLNGTGVDLKMEPASLSAFRIMNCSNDSKIYKQYW